jgi:hypothetical protein
MSHQRVRPFQHGSVHQRCSIDVFERAGESLAPPAVQNMKKSIMELCEYDASIAPEDRAQIRRSPKQMHTIKADPQ